MKDGFLLADSKLEVCGPGKSVALVASKKVSKYIMSMMQGH